MALIERLKAALDQLPRRRVSHETITSVSQRAEAPSVEQIATQPISDIAIIDNIKQELQGLEEVSILASTNTHEANQIPSLSIPQKLGRVAIKLQQLVITQLERKIFFPREAKRLKRSLGKINSIVDIGSGKGYFADSLAKEMPEVHIVSTDVENKHIGKGEFVQANGTSLPFPDGSFDAATIFYVLHHIDHPEIALREAIRISRLLIVQEDTYTNAFQKTAYMTHIKSYQLNSSASGGAIVRTDQEWEAVFASAGLKIAAKHRVHKLGYPVTRYEYQLIGVSTS